MVNVSGSLHGVGATDILPVDNPRIKIHRRIIELIRRGILYLLSMY